MIRYGYKVFLKNTMASVQASGFALKKTRRFFCVLIVCACTFSGTAQAFFSGNVGAGLSLSTKSNFLNPVVSSQGFFSGQIEFSPAFQGRMHFSGFSGNLVGLAPEQFADAFFRINGLALSYKHTIWPDTNNYLTLFFNEDDYISTDTFVRRYLSANAMDSALLKSAHTDLPITLYPMGGLGLSYAIRFQKPMALALYGYVDSTKTNTTINGDVRFAAKWQNFLFDAAFGIRAIGDKFDANGNPVLLLLRTAALRASVSMLIGSENASHVFVQGGIYRGLVYPQNKQQFSIDDFFVLFEPRFRFFSSRLDFTLFILPKEVSSQMFVTQDPIGGSVSYFYDSFVRQNISFGAHFTVSSPSLTGIESAKTLSWILTPELSVETQVGTFEAAIRLNLLQIANPDKSFMVKVTYRKPL